MPSKIKYLNYITFFLAVSTVVFAFVTKYLNISKRYPILLCILTVLCYFISREVIEKEMEAGKSSEKMKEMIKEQSERKNEKNEEAK